MKKNFIILIMFFCVNNLFAQKELYNDIIYPDGGTKGITSVTYWNKTNLYYYIHNYGGGLTYTQCQTAIQNAFNTWSQYSKFTFTQTYNLSQADIELSWENPVHSGCSSFGSNDLAHASLGKLNRTPPTFIHFNNTITFSMNSSGYNLEAIALHEIGHVLGFDHDLSHQNAVMWPSYGYKTDLTSYDYNALYSIYGFPTSIEGPQYICQHDTCHLNNLNKLPSNFTVSWSLDDSNYNNYIYLISNNPSKGYCIIARNPNHDMMNATLTAKIKKGNTVIRVIEKNNMYVYQGFKGSYTSGNLSGNINSSGTFNIKTNTVTTVTSPNFYGATVSYSSSGATPSSWGFNSSSGILNFNTLNTTVPVIINVSDGCGNNYTLYAFPSGSYSINVSNGDGDITVTLVEDGDASKDFTLDEPWTMEITSATTGKVMATLSSTCRSETISTAGWPKGIYIVKVTIGKEELTEKVLVK